MRPHDSNPNSRTRPGPMKRRPRRAPSPAALAALSALGALAGLGIRPRIAHCHGGRPVIVADLPPGVMLHGPVAISRPAGGGR